MQRVGVLKTLSFWICHFSAVSFLKFEKFRHFVVCWNKELFLSYLNSFIIMLFVRCIFYFWHHFCSLPKPICQKFHHFVHLLKLRTLRELLEQLYNVGTGGIGSSWRTSAMLLSMEIDNFWDSFIIMLSKYPIFWHKLFK